jgi:Fe-S-cluster containining protein
VSPPDCRACGVCCFSTLDRYVAVSGDDYERLGDDAETKVRFIENRAYMRMVGGRCAALQIDRGAGFLCTVYDRRPQICRDLERGSPQCAGELANKSARPALV